MQIRIAVEQDVAATIELWLVAAENDSRPVDTPEVVRTLIARDPDACLVAEEDGRILGTLIVGWDGWRAHLYRLAVHPEARRRGIGKALLTAGSQRLRELGATRIDSMVLEGNDLGAAIWSADGFQRPDDWRRWVKPL